MAQNVQNVTLALTLPISCHICLGKVRQPVICVNHHVFCSSCIDLWLKNNNQCPACRVPITPENPCKDIIGGTSENESVLSHSVRKHLRKTRLELLQKEYEDEIEALLRETEELKRTNLTLEEKLNRVPGVITEPVSCNCENMQAATTQTAKSNVCDKLLEDWKRKLEMVNAANKKVTEDIDKLKEENRRLKNESIELVRENLRLKNEVDLRSPQKFGRFTVAALQAKVDQYEREMSRLKKALERSDQYIEELEAQIVQLKKPPEDKQIEKSQCGNTALMEKHTGRAATSHVCLDNSTAKLIPKQSHENGIYSETSEGLCSNSAKLFNPQSKTLSSPKLKYGLHSAMWNGKDKASLDTDSPEKDIISMSQVLNSPSSSLPFSSLRLNTPDSKTSSFSNTNLKKPLTYLRKLVFDDLPQRRELGKTASAGSEPSVNNANGTTQPEQTNAVFSNFCHIIGNPQGKNSEKTDCDIQLRKQGTNATDQILSRPHTIGEEDLNHPGTSHENSMDVNSTHSNNPTNASSVLKSHINPLQIPHLIPDWVKSFQNDSAGHICEFSENNRLYPNESSNLSRECNSLPSSSADNEEQAYMSTDRSQIDFNNHLHSSVLPCISLQPTEEVSPDSDKVLPSGLISEPTSLPSAPPQTYTGSPPAKRKLLNSCTNSPSKSFKH